MITEAEFYQKITDLMTDDEREEALKSIDEQMNILTKNFARIIELEKLYRLLILQEITGEEFCERRDSIMPGDTG